MRILLDTHVWIWGLTDPQRLPPRLQSTLQDQRSEIHLSPVTIWETLVLARKGRLNLDLDAVAWVEHALAVSRTRMVPVTHAIAIASERLPDFPTRDPADRFLAATAVVERLTLATLDRALLEYPEVKTVS